MGNQKETVDACIAQEKTKDLVNIHNFLTSIFIHDTENLSVFALQLKLQLALHARAKKEPMAAKYLELLNQMLDEGREKTKLSKGA